MKNLKQLLRFTLSYKIPTLLNIVYNIISALSELLALVLFTSFLKLLFDKSIEVVTTPPSFELSEKYLTNYFNFLINQYTNQAEKQDILLFICLVIVGLFLIKNFSRYMAMFHIAKMRNGVVKDLRNRIYKKINTLPISYFSENKKGELIAKITNDVQVLEFSILNTIEVIFRDPIMVILSLAIMISMNSYLTIFSFILLPLSGIAINRLGKSLKRSSNRVQEKIGQLISNVEETLSAAKIIKTFNAQESMNKKFETLNYAHYKDALKMSRKKDLASPLSEFLGSTVMISLVYFGGRLVLGEKIDFTGERFIVYILIFARILPPIKQIVSSYASIQKGAASAERIEGVLKEDNPIKDPIQPKTLNKFKTHISLKDVSFEYKPNQPVLHHININLKKGSSTALIGESGSGKSTIANLILRFYDVTQGAIKIDDIDIKDFKVKDLRKKISMVTQDSILFNDSITQNIVFGAKNIDENRVVEAAKIANAHEFITKLEGGYDFEIGDGGNKLSGGQKQRICIARAVYEDADILILDEATSALDNHSEKLVQEALEKIMINKTSIVIAHRLSTIEKVDNIIALKDGRVIESGAHQTLLKKPDGVYANLLKSMK